MADELAPSRIVTGTQIPEGHGAPVLMAHGEPDDHLRLTVLLADALGARSSGAQLREAAETCKTAKNVSWKTRLDALSYLLEHAPPPEGRKYGALLVDIDALDTRTKRPDELWDDRDFCRQRGELLEVVLDAVGEGGWLVVRTNPSSESLQRLDSVRDLGFIETEEATLGPDEAETALGAPPGALSPECRPLLAWIVRTGTLPVRDIGRLLEAGEAGGFEKDILGVAYEAIPSHARKAAKRLAALRGFQPKNGMLGPFHLLDDAVPGEVELAADAALRLGASTLPMEARAVRCLTECGFLQPGPARGGHPTLRMPRAVRAHLLPLAKLWDPDLIEGQHRVWGAASIDDLALDEQLETHFHAVQGGNLEDSLRTARYYVTDLRALAFRLSHEERHAEAAEVYRTIVRDFDPEDAYAWEYLAFNLAFANGQAPLSGERAEEIRRAYVTACELDPKNPLYQGRLLGLRAQLGEDVRIEFHRGMKRYLAKHGEHSKAISYFAEPVMRGMLRGSGRATLRGTIEPFLSVLAKHKQIQPLLWGQQ